MRVFTFKKKDGCSLRQERDIPETNILESMYEIIDCRTVGACDFTHRGVTYTVWYDDEFMLGAEPPVATLILGDLKPNGFTLLCGNLLFSRTDGDGKTIGLSKRDIRNLWEFTDINSIRLRMAFAKKLINVA